MRFWVIIMIAIFLLIPVKQLSAQEGQQPAVEEGAEEGAPVPPEDQVPMEEERAAPMQQLREELEKVAPEELVKEGEGPKRVTIDAVVVVKYTFSGGADSYSVKYHLNMGGEVAGETGMIKGNARIATDISGYLENNPGLCQCLLKVSISDVPYEVVFKRTSETEADIEVSFKGQILEDWQSLCTFLDASGAKFNTRGAPERWIGLALEKAKPSLTRLTAPLDAEKSTSIKFAIPKYTVEDTGLGDAEIEGTGIVTIESIRKKIPEKK